MFTPASMILLRFCLFFKLHDGLRYINSVAFEWYRKLPNQLWITIHRHVGVYEKTMGGSEMTPGKLTSPGHV